MIKYYIDGIYIMDYNIHIEASKGLLDFPGIKDKTTANYADSDGVYVDLSKGMLKPRSITLKCTSVCDHDKLTKDSGYIYTAKNINRFAGILRSEGLHRLEVVSDTNYNKRLVYDVYLNGDISIDKGAMDERVSIAEFEVNLIEPFPNKIVYKVNAPNGLIYVDVSVNKSALIDISWGDKGRNYNELIVDDKAITHTYEFGGEYYIIISGDIESINGISFKSSGGEISNVEVWKSL